MPHFECNPDLEREDLECLAQCELYLTKLLRLLTESERLTSEAIPHVLMLHNILSIRVYELSWAALDLLKKGKVVPGAILSRSVGETVSLILAHQRHLDECLDTNDGNALNENAKNILFGSRAMSGPEGTLPKAVNVLTYIEKMNHTIPDFRSLYDRLSEYCHPNWPGLFACMATSTTSTDGPDAQEFTSSSVGSLRHAMTLSALFLGVSIREALKLAEGNIVKIATIKQRLS